MTEYAIVQERFEQIDPEVLRQVMVDHGGLNRIDATRLARKAQGVLWERFTMRQAQQVATELNHHDYRVRPVPAKDLVKLDKPRTVRRLEFFEDHFDIPWDLHRSVSIPWLNVFVISAAETRELVEKRRERPSRGTGRPTGEAAYVTETEIERSSKRISVTDIVALTAVGGFAHFRLPAHELHYNRILTDAASYRPYERYLMVLQRIGDSSKQAIVSPRTRHILVERQEPRSLAGTEDQVHVEEMNLDRYNEWLMQLVRFREDEQSEA